MNTQTKWQFSSFVDLKEFLRHWTFWGGDEGPYDVVGMMCLLGACLDNLREFALHAELEDVGECLTPEQAEFLQNLATQLARTSSDARASEADE